MLERLCRLVCRTSVPKFRFLRQISGHTSTRQYEEVEIKVPWGKIAGKRWGNPHVQPIIAVHGWQDNAGSYDPLVQHLPEDLSVLAIDLPGHGRSSWIPSGMMYSKQLCVQTMYRVQEHLGIDKIGIIAHSMGGIVSFYFTSLFPDSVKFVVALDFYKPPILDETKYFTRFHRLWDGFFKFEKTTTPAPSYTEEEAIQMWIKATKNSIDESSCRLLMTRGVGKNPDGTVFFNRDPRLKAMGIEADEVKEYIKLLGQQIKCPYMILKAEESDHNEPKGDYYEFMEGFKESVRDLQFHVVPGTHHFHMNSPSAVAELIYPFVTKWSQ